MRKKPPWLDDAPELKALLGRFLDKLDRRPAAEWRQPPSIALEPKAFPELYRLDELSDRTWQLFRQLEAENVWEIRLKRRCGPYEAEFSGARIHLRLDAEPLLRDWLDRPRQEPYTRQWQLALESSSGQFSGDPAALRSRPVPIPGRSAREVVQAFAAIGEFATEKLTLRQLSSRCFWGDSKLLDGREDLLRALYPELRITPRRLLVNVYLPPQIEGVLFIENLDSYLDAVEQRSLTDSAGLVLVYSAGFRSSAERVRQRDMVRLHYTGNTSPAQIRQLEAWWFGSSDSVMPCHFWGDLDYAGIAILKALRLRFPDTEAWRPGYAPMLQRLAAGHRVVDAGKQEQVDPGASGCAYADGQLLPAIREQGRFLDQESLTWKACMIDRTQQRDPVKELK